MGNYQQLRMQNVMSGYGQIPGGNMGYSDEDYAPNPSSPYTPGPGLEQVGAQQLGGEPESQPELANIQAPTIQAPTAARYNADDSVERTMELINKVYTPENTSRDRFNRLMDAFPERNNPTKSDRFSAIMMGLGAGGRQGGNAIDTMDKVLQAPYMRDVEEWKTKSDPYGKAYQFENASNVNERQLAGNVVTAQVQANRLAENARQADAKAENVRQKNMIADYVARGAKVVPMPHSPTLWMAGPDGKPFNTGVPTGALTEAEAIHARGTELAKAWDTRAASQAANQQEIPFERPNPRTGVKETGYIRGGKWYPVEEAAPGERPGARPAGPGVGTTHSITPPGSTPGQPAAPSAPGKPVGALSRVGTESEAKPLTPLEERMKLNNTIAGIISRHRNWKNFVGYNEDTKLYEGMLDPPPAPRTAGWFGIGGGGASDEEWQQYKDDMDGYNQLRSLLHPGAPPLKVVGGSNAEQKAQREKAAATAPPPTPTTTPPNTGPTKGIGPSGSTNAAPSASGSAGIGPSTTPSTSTTAPNDPKSLPGGTEERKTWMPDTGGKYAFLPDWVKPPWRDDAPATPTPKPAAPKQVVPQAPVPSKTPPVSTTSKPTMGDLIRELPEEQAKRASEVARASLPPFPAGADLQFNKQLKRYRYYYQNRLYEVKGDEWVEVK